MSTSWPNVFGCLTDYPKLSVFLATLGFVCVAKFALRTVSVLAQTFLLPGTSLKKFRAGKGAWAVVTGASDGIGAEFAVQLADAGFNVFLVARSHEKLSEIASRIADRAAAKGKTVSTVIHVLDFLHADEKAFENLKALCAALDVTVLVNNVGKSHAIPTYFVEGPKNEIDDILKINVNGTVNVTYSVLPQMIKQKCGLILNVGSFAGAIPSPMLAVYSGSKAFLATFSAALAEEVKEHGIKVEHLNTFFVVSKLSKTRPSIVSPKPAAYVRSVLSKIGLPCGAACSGRPGTSTPFWSHSVLDYLRNLIGYPSIFISYTHGLHKQIRKRALRKAEREAKRQ